MLKIAEAAEERLVGLLMVWCNGQGVARVLDHDGDAIHLERGVWPTLFRTERMTTPAALSAELWRGFTHGRTRFPWTVLCRWPDGFENCGQRPCGISTLAADRAGTRYPRSKMLSRSTVTFTTVIFSILVSAALITQIFSVIQTERPQWPPAVCLGRGALWLKRLTSRVLGYWNGCWRMRA